MKSAELIALAYYGGIALLLSTLGILVLGLLLQLERRFRRWLILAVVPLMTLGIALSTLFSRRVLTYAYEDIQSIGGGGPSGGTNVLRVVTLIILALCLVLVIARLFKNRARQATAPAGGGQALFVAFLIYFVANAVINGIFGTRPAFVHNNMYMPLLFAAVFVVRDLPVADFIRTAKFALVCMMVFSLAAAFVIPDATVQPNYRNGWIPGLTSRLWGLGSNPNSLAPMAVLLLLLEWASPSRSWAHRLIVVGPALIVLLLAQSKTTLAALMGLAPVLVWYRWGKAPQGGARIGFVLTMVVLASLALVAIWMADPQRILNKLAAGQVGTDVSTLTGRLRIWQAAIGVWQDNPGFGYGPLAWDALHRWTLGLPAAFSAHNQFLESLSSAGLLGLITLLGYLGLLSFAAWRAAPLTHGASLGLLLLIWARSITEAPLELGNVFSADAIAHLVLFRLALLAPVVTRQPRMAVLRGRAATAQ